MKINRREWIGVGLGALAGLIPGHLAPKTTHAAQPSNHQDWKKPKPIDLKQAGERAYDGYRDRGLGCCHGVFKGLAGPLLEEMGPPYSAFPVEIMRAGKSGVADAGSLCGALLGAAYAFHLFFDPKVADSMQKELHRWYSQTLLLQYIPETSHFRDYSVPKTKAILPECHASIDIWIKTAGFAKETDERRERCGRLTADVALKAGRIWNAHLAGSSFSETPITEKQAYCGKCHIKGIAPGKDNPDYRDGKHIREVGTDMSCPSCHPGRRRNHPKSRRS